MVWRAWSVPFADFQGYVLEENSRHKIDHVSSSPDITDAGQDFTNTCMALTCLKSTVKQQSTYRS